MAGSTPLSFSGPLRSQGSYLKDFITEQVRPKQYKVDKIRGADDGVAEPLVNARPSSGLYTVGSSAANAMYRHGGRDIEIAILKGLRKIKPPSEASSEAPSEAPSETSSETSMIFSEDGIDKFLYPEEDYTSALITGEFALPEYAVNSGWFAANALAANASEGSETFGGHKNLGVLVAFDHDMHKLEPPTKDMMWERTEFSNNDANSVGWHRVVTRPDLLFVKLPEDSAGSLGQTVVQTFTSGMPSVPGSLQAAGQAVSGITEGIRSGVQRITRSVARRLQDQGGTQAPGPSAEPANNPLPLSENSLKSLCTEGKLFGGTSDNAKVVYTSVEIKARFARDSVGPKLGEYRHLARQLFAFYAKQIPHAEFKFMMLEVYAPAQGPGHVLVTDYSVEQSKAVAYWCLMHDVMANRWFGVSKTSPGDFLSSNGITLEMFRKAQFKLAVDIAGTLFLSDSPTRSRIESRVGPHAAYGEQNNIKKDAIDPREFLSEPNEFNFPSIPGPAAPQSDGVISEFEPTVMIDKGDIYSRDTRNTRIPQTFIDYRFMGRMNWTRTGLRRD